MKILKRVGIGLVIVLVLAVGLAFLLPRNVRVERSTTIEAPAETVFALANGFKRFNEWSPWAAMDPSATYGYEGPDHGVGAKMSWKGDPKTVGQGTNTIVESVPGERVRTALDFGDQGTGFAEFTFVPEDGATRVTWSFETDLGMNPVSRYFGLMLDSMIGADYEKGLQGMKTLAESLPKTDFGGLDWTVLEVPPVPIAFVERRCGKDEAEIAATIGAAYQKVGGFMGALGLRQAAAPITINREWEDAGYVFEAAIPIDRMPESPVPPDSEVQVKTTYAGKVLRVVHKGAYREMEGTYEKLFACAAAYGYERAGDPWDEYVTDPGTTPEPELLTNVFLPVR